MHLIPPSNLINPESVTFEASNVVSTSMSPFTYKKQVFRHQGQRWNASVKIPPVRREEAEPWISFLMSLEGQTHTFELGDPNATLPQGGSYPTVLQVQLNKDSQTATVVISNGSLSAGDMFSVGSGENKRLYKVLEDVSGTSGESFKIWPRPLVTTSAAADVTSPKGVFRLTSNSTSFNINSSSVYGISFDCEGVV